MTKHVTVYLDQHVIHAECEDITVHHNPALGTLSIVWTDTHDSQKILYLKMDAVEAVVAREIPPVVSAAR